MPAKPTTSTSVGSLPALVLDRLRAGDPAHVWSSRDFLDLGPRATVDQALSRLVKSGSVIRPARGLYALHRRNERLGIAISPSFDDVARAIARRNGCRIMPTGATAANRLGLSTQVPAKPVYLSDGRSRKVRVGKANVEFRRISARRLDASSEKNALILSALLHLGKHALDGRTTARIRALLGPGEHETLILDARAMPAWLCDFVRRSFGAPQRPQRPKARARKARSVGRR